MTEEQQAVMRDKGPGLVALNRCALAEALGVADHDAVGVALTIVVDNRVMTFSSMPPDLLALVFAMYAAEHVRADAEAEAQAEATPPH